MIISYLNYINLICISIIFNCSLVTSIILNKLLSKINIITIIPFIASNFNFRKIKAII